MSGDGEGSGTRRARPWQAERPGAAAARQSATDELFTLVAFDVACDKTRRKLGEICKDYGLKRAQWSVFEGEMTRNRREELSARMSLMLRSAEGGGRAAVYPIGAREASFALRVATKGVPVKATLATAAPTKGKSAVVGAGAEAASSESIEASAAIEVSAVLEKGAMESTTEDAGGGGDG